jgi:glycosyltransferase involved in cell wall biosynthesis
MRVALVVTEVGRGIGGRYTFQEMIVDAVGRLRDETHHEFATLAAGFSRYTEGSRRWRLRRMAKVSATIAVRAVHDIQDNVLGKRLVHARTPLQRALEAARADLVWFPTTYAEDVESPYIATVFDLEHRIKPWFPEVSAHGEFERRDAFYRRYLPKATRVIVPNTSGVAQVGRFYDVLPENCLSLPHPTPEFALRAADVPQRPDAVVRMLGVQGRYLVYPAQFWPHKNHAAALDALVELRSRGEDVGLVFVGSDVGHRSHVQSQIESRGLSGAVRLLGYVTEDQLVALYQHADALLYVSRFGPENLPPLEALALGCPAIVGEVAGAAEQMGDAAIIVDAADSAAVADAVLRVCEPRERAELVARGTKRARSWTAEDYVRAVIRFIDEFERERRLWV